MARLITIPSRWLNPLVLVLTLALSSCGGGTNTAGAGGSGIGGTGITTVTGNVSQVITDAQEEEQAIAGRMLARAMSWLASPVNAQSTPLDDILGGIRVFGGGQVTTTDDDGSFVLEDVTPSNNFTLRFELEDNRTIALPLGAIPAGSVARVNDIVLNLPQGVATPANVDIEENVDENLPDDPGNSNNPGNPDNPGQSGGASDNNNATGASGNSNPNSSEQANNANNNNAGGASSGADANNN